MSSRRSCSRSGNSSCCGSGDESDGVCDKSGGADERREVSREGWEGEDAVGRRALSRGPADADADAGVPALPVHAWRAAAILPPSSPPVHATHRPCPLSPPSMCRPSSPSRTCMVLILILRLVGFRRRCRCSGGGSPHGAYASIAACTGEAMVVVISVCNTGGLPTHELDDGTRAPDRSKSVSQHRPGRHRM